MDAELIKLFSLEGRGAVITGGASGIGRQTAITFAQAGARVTICDIDVAGLDRTADLVRPYDPQVSIARLDVRDRALIVEVAAAADQRHGLDIWVNSAGVLPLSPLLEATPEKIDFGIDVNLKGTLWCSIEAARIMSARKRGSIINVSSTGADILAPQIALYALTKQAVNQLTRNLAFEVGPDGVRVNAIAPGTIDTPMVTGRMASANERVDEATKEAVFKERAGRTALRRVGLPTDIAMTMLYLASDASSYVTGQILRTNGGMSMP